jgi:hypothetical protein
LIVTVKEYVSGIEYKKETNDFKSVPTFFVYLPMTKRLEILPESIAVLPREITPNGIGL